MGFTCVLIKEEAEGAGPQSHHQNQRALATTRIAESPRAKERGERSFIHKPYQGGFLPLKTNAGRLFSGTKNPPVSRAMNMSRELICGRKEEGRVL